MKKYAMQIEYYDDGRVMKCKLGFLLALFWVMFSREIIIINPKREKESEE